jgi:hypothetical protein
VRVLIWDLSVLRGLGGVLFLFEGKREVREEVLGFWGFFGLARKGENFVFVLERGKKVGK